MLGCSRRMCLFTHLAADKRNVVGQVLRQASKGRQRLLTLRLELAYNMWGNGSL
jgi:hypothetical protein